MRARVLGTRAFSQIDTRTSEGRKWFIDVANNVEYERAMISRRTKEWVQGAKKSRRKFGRSKGFRAQSAPTVMTVEMKSPSVICAIKI